MQQPPYQPNGYYQAPTQQYSMYPPVPPPPPKRSLWQRYRGARRRTRWSIGCVTLILLLMLCMCSSALAAPKTTTLTPTATPAQVAQLSTQGATPAPTQPRPTATHAPIPTATPKPTQPPAPTATPVPVQPTQPPAPTATPVPVHTGLHGNPWGYDLNAPGGLIYNPPATICDYFNCIASFWTHTNGYVDECVDGTYSHSGGVTGACSKHGGEAQPLYSH